MENKLYTVTELLKRMKAKGLPGSRMWLYTSEASGKLLCPRRPNSRRDRAFTESQIEEIIEAFSPTGIGEWRYE